MSCLLDELSHCQCMAVETYVSFASFSLFNLMMYTISLIDAQPPHKNAVTLPFWGNIEPGKKSIRLANILIV